LIFTVLSFFLVLIFIFFRGLFHFLDFAGLPVPAERGLLPSAAGKLISRACGFQKLNWSADFRPLQRAVGGIVSKFWSALVHSFVDVGWMDPALQGGPHPPCDGCGPVN